ncbi:MAG: VacJ family lipoprotein [Alphaproteobacteria bacterium]|nr:VacJ family lipoprotein [Alphaproteobacteria bacterium]MBV9692566.1 VacJ family lipoprotein [Alphaproteobacteria bacterium]
MFRPLSLIAVFSAALALSGCETTSNPDSLAQNDPYEPTNREVFAFNQGLDKHVARPVAVFYNHAVPAQARDAIHNMLANMDEPVTFANDVLQGEPKRAAQTLGRITFNTTLGIGGMFDIASKMGIPEHTEDFGQTLAVWGAGEGPFLVLPFVGPAPPRDAAGKVVDIFQDPFTYLRFDGWHTLNYARTGMGFVDLRARNVENLDQIERTSVDLYATQRSLYRQFRNSEIRNGAPDKTDLPDL